MPRKQAFSKPALSLDNQLALLTGRGLVIPDAEQAAHYLQFIGYYRLIGYARYFRNPQAVDPERYLDGTTFAAVLELYIFDRKLRVLLFDAIERIEIAIKAAMTDKIAVANGSFWLSDANNFDRGNHQFIIQEIEKAIGDDPSKNPHNFISHFHQKYLEPYPPCWMLMECLSFSAMSRIYKYLRGTHRQAVSAEFLLQHDVLASWLHALSYTRNVCAHHARLWQRSFTIQPQIPREYRNVWPADRGRKLFINCCMIHHLMKVIADGSAWSDRLRDLIANRPGIPLDAMGFPDDWESQDFWAFG